MTQLVVRRLPTDVKDRLRARADRHGRSLEAEVRDILARAAAEGETSGPTPGIGSRIAGLFADVSLGADEISEIRSPMRVADFGE